MTGVRPPSATLKTGFLLGWRPLELIQKRLVDLLDVNAPVLHWLDRLGRLHQLTRGRFGIGEGAHQYFGFGPDLDPSRSWREAVT